MKNITSYDDYKNTALLDPIVRAEYDALEDEFALIAMLVAKTLYKRRTEVSK
jgi:hypothetical protein